MKKRFLVLAFSVALALTGCSAGDGKEVGVNKEPISAAEAAQAVESKETTAAEEAKPTDDTITQEQALEAVKNYCIANNPDLENMLGSDDYTVYFDVSTSEADEIIVLYRSYTGAQIRYYVDKATGEVYVTELVPGIIDEEQRTEETFNIRDYMDK
jgi:hypothetical protein